MCGAGGGVITEIVHASYGAPHGMCGAFVPGHECDHPAAAAAVASLCLGQQECSVPVDAAALGASATESCALVGHLQRLHVQVACSSPHPQLVASAVVPVSSRGSLELPAAAHHAKLMLSTPEQPRLTADTLEQHPAQQGGGEDLLIWERGGDAVSDLPLGVNDVRLEEDGRLVVDVGSGAYSFVLQ